jgi:hypothetical protein
VTVVVRRQSTYCRTRYLSQTRTCVCQPVGLVGPLLEEGLLTLACRPQSLPEEVIQSQLPSLDEPERKMPPGLLVQRMNTARAGA